MSMFDEISNDIKEAMKAGDKAKLSALRMLKSALLENKTAKAPREEQDVVISHCKKLADSLATFPEGHAQREALQAELQALEAYMPQSMDEAAVQTLIDKIVAEQDSANFGTVMKALSPQIKGRFDGKRAAELVKAKL